MRSNRAFLFAGLLLTAVLSACAGPAWWESEDAGDPNQAGPGGHIYKVDISDAGARAAATSADDGPPVDNLGLFRVTNDPSRYELRWNAPLIQGAWTGFRVYQSNADFDDPADAVQVAGVGGTVRSVQLTLPPNSGQAWLGVVGLRRTGTFAEAPVEMSDTLLADTTVRLVFMGETHPIDTASDQGLFSAQFDSSAPPQAVLERISADPAGGSPPPPVQFDFAIAPDGLHVAWIGRHVLRSIYVAALDGSEPIRRVTDLLDVSTNRGPGSFKWSPDSRHMAFGASGDLYVVRADGSEQPQQLNGDITFQYWSQDSYRWLPDGQIAFVSSSGPPSEAHVIAPAVYLVRPDSVEPARRVTDNPVGRPIDGFDCSPDGRYLAYSHSGRLYVAELRNSGSHRRVSDFDRIALPLGWGADSRTLLFRYKDRTQSIHLAVVGENDIQTTQLRTGRFEGAAWSRGRDRVAYALGRDFSDNNGLPFSDIYVTPVADPAASVRVGFVRRPEDLRWSPDGERVYFAAWRPQGGFEARFGYVADPDIEDSYSRVLAPKFVGLSPREAAFSPTSEFFAYSTVVLDLAIPAHAPMLFVERFGEEPRAWSQIAFQVSEDPLTWGSPQLEWTLPGNP